MTQRPLQWELPQCSREAYAHHEFIRHFFPTMTMRQAAVAVIHTLLAKHFGKEVRLFFEDLTTMPYGEFVRHVGESALVGVIGMPPVATRLLIQLDHELAGGVVDRLLGGNGSRSTEPIPFSETEEGVFQYLVMQGCADLHAACGLEAPFHFRFERFLRRLTVVEEQHPAREPVVVATWRLGIEQQMGIVRLVIPHRFAREAALRAQPHSTGAGPAYEQAGRFSDAPVELWVEAGRSELSPAELSSIEVGDVVVLDQTEIHLQRGKLAGRVRLRAGLGLHGGVLCDVIDAATLQCRVHDVEQRG